MNLKYKVWVVKVPPKTGPEPEAYTIPFNAESHRKTTLISLGIDPTLSDEELKEYYTYFSTSLKDILHDSNENFNKVNVLDYINSESKKIKDSIDNVNREYKETYKDSHSKWENGYNVVKKTYIDSTDKETNLIKYIENSENFYEWLDDEIIELVETTVSNQDDKEMIAFKCKDLYVYTPLTSVVRSEIELLAQSSNLDIVEVSIDDITNEDKVISLYQFYEYIDSINSNNTVNVVVDMIVDREQSNKDNLNLGGVINPFLGDVSVSEFSFNSKDTVENFNSFDVINKLETLFAEDE